MNHSKQNIRLGVMGFFAMSIGVFTIYNWFQKVSDPPYIPIFVCDPSDPVDTRECLAAADGICARGQRRCHSSGRYWLDQCEPMIMPEDRAEICDNGEDDNCDGWMDEVGCRPQIRTFEVDDFEFADQETIWDGIQDSDWWMVDLSQGRRQLRRPLGCEPHERGCQTRWEGNRIRGVYWIPSVFEEDPSPFEGGYRYAGRLWEGDMLRAGEIGLFCVRDVAHDVTLCDYHVCDAPEACRVHQFLLDIYTVVSDAYHIADGRWIERPPIPEVFFRSQI